MVIQAVLEIRDHRASQVQLERAELPVTKDHKVQLVVLDSVDRLDLLETRDLLELPEVLEILDSRARRGLRVTLVIQGHRDLQDFKVPKANSVRQGLRVMLVQQEYVV
jgi:hypothetical protein